MRRTILIISAILFISANLLAQKMNGIKTDLFSPILRTGVFKVERVINEDISIQLGFFYTGYHQRDSEVTLKGYGITPELRYYLSETPAPNGAYLAPNIRYMDLTAEDPLLNEEATLSSIGLAVNLGKQWLLKDMILIDAWIGPSYNFRTVEDVSGNVDIGISEANGFGLRLGLAIGIAF
jgi:hypothetical protein